MGLQQVRQMWQEIYSDCGLSLTLALSYFYFLFYVRPVEVVEFNKEYTEDDVTDEVVKGSLSFGTLEQGALDFPGLRSDIEGITRSFFGGLNRFFEEAEGMKNEFWNAFGAPRVFDGESSSSPSMRRGIPVEEEGHPKPVEAPESGHVDLSGLAKDVWSIASADGGIACQEK